MRKILFLSFFITIFASLCWRSPADVGSRSILPAAKLQPSAPARSFADEDGAIDVVLSDKNRIKRVPPDNPSLKAGDCLRAFPRSGSATRSLLPEWLPTTKKHSSKSYLRYNKILFPKTSQRARRWRSRGIKGRVTALNPQQRITIVLPFLTVRNYRFKAKGRSRIFALRAGYFNFEAAQKSSFTDISAGDTIEALGDKSEDGAILKRKRSDGRISNDRRNVTATDAEKAKLRSANLQPKRSNDRRR